MSSQVPFTPVTPAALGRLTEEERAVFVSAAEQVCERDIRPGFGECVTLIEIIGRLITSQPDSGFGHRFTVIPDSGITELHCSSHAPEARQWQVGYHPSLDVLIEQAQAHNATEHGEVTP